METDIHKTILANGGEIEQGEVFKQCVGYPRYYVSSKGRVFSTCQMKYLKPAVDGKMVESKRIGYLFVVLQKETGTYECRYIHRLVAEAFLENPQKYSDVHHIDKNKYNNKFNNLKFCSRKENLKDAICVPITVTHIESGRIYRFNSITDAAEELCLPYFKIYQRIGKGKVLSGFIFDRS